MRNYNKTLYALIAILVIYTVSFVAFIMYSITNFAFSDFYKRLDLRRDLAAERMLNGKADQKDWSLSYLEELNNQHEFIVQFDEKADIVNSSGFNVSLWERVNKQGEANFKEGNTFYSTKLYQQEGKNYIVGVSAENYFYTHHLRYLQNLLLIALLLGVLFVVVVSLLVKRSFIKPIHGLIDEVKKIGSENLYLRLSEEKYKGVLHKLANTFNGMLNRVETSFETQKNFISNASHELNTPLTSIIGIADLALSKDRTVQQYKEAMQKIVDAAGNLEKKTSALLLLARTGYERNNKLNFKPVRIDQIIMDAEMTVKAINERFHIKTDFSMLPDDSMKLKVNGLAPLLQLAISNVVSNACKYSPDHTAYVALGAFENGVLILIKDEGIGIPEKEISYIYDPISEPQIQHFSGYGIGLPLARNIIKMHDGELSITSSLGKGTTVRIELPTFTPI